ncbi:hypothetical protein GYMLUDRAFT_72910 [Collybiopsis luxurians FD-317 M1]|uniref:F-box domain-containing protein n=1 Tax=Collybiopsis luxurians FD-317 M1 TaxID=944289 RepID=A0A0D0CGR3_9AGAR|nr:hypothetical protein GYMLUDRAFT_72910 [Collybiopsis luxurians FD-317 M1]
MSHIRTSESLINDNFLSLSPVRRIDDLPNEILAHLLYLGCDDPPRPSKRIVNGLYEFQTGIPYGVNVSHVCQRWRDVAIGYPLIWTQLHFHYGVSMCMLEIFIERSRGNSLDIIMSLDGRLYSTKSRKLVISKFLDMVIPLVERWRCFSLASAFPSFTSMVLKQLSECSSAPLLEILHIVHFSYNDMHSGAELFLPFQGNTPKLRSVDFQGSWIDLEGYLPQLRDLHDLRLTNIAPSFQTFTRILSQSPTLGFFGLTNTGPADLRNVTPISLPSLEHLSLSHHPSLYIEYLFPFLQFPNIKKLELEYSDGDYTKFALMMATRLPGATKSLLTGLEHLVIHGLSLTQNALEPVLEQLVNLQSLAINCSEGKSTSPKKFQAGKFIIDQLAVLKQTPSGSQRVVFCPRLTCLMTTGIVGGTMVNLVAARQKGGASLSTVRMTEKDEVDGTQREWLQQHLDNLYFFKLSGSWKEDWPMQF